MDRRIFLKSSAAIPLAAAWLVLALALGRAQERRAVRPHAL